MSEEDWQQTVIDLAHIYGWRIAHFRKARLKNGGWRTPVSGDGKGFPDNILARTPRVIIAELKSEDGVIEIEQQKWLTLFMHCPGVEVYVWKPSDYEGVKKILK